MNTGKSFGPVSLAPGYSRTNASGVMLAAFAAIPLVAFINFAQPFLLQEVYKVPLDQQGMVTGQLAAMQEVVVLLLMGLVGAASDNFGRRIMMVIGLCVVALGLSLYPLGNTVPELYGYRLVFAVGAAMVPVMYSVSVQDTPANRSRGLFTAMGSVCTGLGMMLVALQVGKLPGDLVADGLDPVVAGRYTYWSMVVFALVMALLVRLTWRAGRVSESEPRQPPLQLLREGFACARNNPRISLAYLTAFASRGDLVVIGTFLSLWVVQAGNDAGVNSAEGLARAGIMVAVIQGTAMLWAPVMGIISDRINRVAAVMIGFAIAGVAYSNMSLHSDPFSSGILIACVGLGVGEISSIISGSALLGQEAPAERRGSVVGVFGLVGALSILCTTYVGGMIFDSIGRTAPFGMMGVINMVVALVALLVLIKSPGLSAREVRQGVTAETDRG